MFRRVATLHGVKKTLPIEPQKPFKLWEGGKTNLPPLKTEITVDSDMLIDNFKQMVRIRRMEQLADQSYKLKKIRGFCHLYIGQESIAVGMENVLTFDDAVVTAYRDHGWYVVRGGQPYDVFCEMFWKKDGCSKGKGGSMHMYNVKNNFYGGNGIVGAQVPIGVGLAWKHSYTNGQESPKNVSVALYGDGAANQGQIFEVMNMAALYKIPAIFVCENNQFGMGTSKKRASAQPEFYRRCDYIPGVYADGMCTLSVQEATRYAKEYCLAGNGPIIIEFDSYRYMGHSMSDPDSAYRKPEDIEAVRSKRDCIENLRYVISSNGFMAEPQLKEIEKEIRKQVDSEHTKAHAAAIQDDMKELVNDIYAKDGPTKVPIRGCQGNVWLA